MHGSGVLCPNFFESVIQVENADVESTEDHGKGFTRFCFEAQPGMVFGHRSVYGGISPVFLPIPLRERADPL